MRPSSRPATTLVACAVMAALTVFPVGPVAALAQEGETDPSAVSDGAPDPSQSTGAPGPSPSTGAPDPSASAAGAPDPSPPTGAPDPSASAAGAPDPSPPTGAPAAQAGGSGRPKLALVLSGGGARGAAHIGVIKVLEELHVPADMIAGTSMGSIVGGLYATGWSPQEMEDLLVHMDWNTLFVDRLARDERSYRRKQDDVRFHIPFKMRFKNGKPYLPPGVLGGQRLELFLRALQIQSTGQTDFAKFPIPYVAVAADIVTGEAVVLDHGSLADAMRASMSIPGAFAPAIIDGRKLVDGGAVANLPIRVAQDLGAQAVIAVDITSPLYEEEQISSALNIMNQQSSFLTVGNRIEDLKRLGPQDVLIRPELGDLSFADFARAP